MTPIDVRDRLQGMGFDMAKYTNDLAAVHTILKRLNDAGELRFVARPDGKPQYAPSRTSLPIVLAKDIVGAMHDHAAERAAMNATEDPDDPPARRRRRAPSRRKKR